MKFFLNKYYLPLGLLLLSWITFAQNAQTTLPTCTGTDVNQWHGCRGILDDAEFSYAGDFVHGKFEGRGILEFTGEKYQGDYYQGEFKNGLKNGYGIYHFANGDKYSGEYQYGKRQGKGSYFFGEGKPTASGVWSNNYLINNTPSDPDLKNLDNSSFSEKKKIDSLKSEILQGKKEIPKDSVKTENAKPRDAVAIILGVQNYQRLPIASYAGNDAVQFRDYAIRYLGVQPDHVKLLIDSEAQRSDILLAFKYWLPQHVNTGHTDVYVYFSGHGLLKDHPNEHYWLPYDVNTDLLEETAINQEVLLKQASQIGAKSVVVFLDTCFSGSTRLGNPLIQKQRGVNIKLSPDSLPPGVSLLSAGTSKQVANSDNALKHGLFTFFLLKGLAGEPSANLSKPIKLGSLADFVTQQTSSYAFGINKMQTPQFRGNREHTLVY